MKRLFIAGASLLMGINLAGCSSDTSSQRAQHKEIWPAKSTMVKAENAARDMSKVEFLEKNMKDKPIRYSDILNFKKSTKYTGNVKTADGDVVQITKQKDGLRQIILDESGYDKDHIWVVESYTTQNIRKKDNLAVGLVVAGPVKYYNSDNQPVKAVEGFAPSSQVINDGAD